MVEEKLIRERKLSHAEKYGFLERTRPLLAIALKAVEAMPHQCPMPEASETGSEFID